MSHRQKGRKTMQPNTKHENHCTRHHHVRTSLKGPINRGSATQYSLKTETTSIDGLYRKNKLVNTD